MRRVRGRGRNNIGLVGGAGCRQQGERARRTDTLALCGITTAVLFASLPESLHHRSRTVTAVLREPHSLGEYVRALCWTTFFSRKSRGPLRRNSKNIVQRRPCLHVLRGMNCQARHIVFARYVIVK